MWKSVDGIWNTKAKLNNKGAWRKQKLVRVTNVN